MTKTYDAIVIGSGQSGPSLAVRLADSGMQVLLVERERYGGTCVNTGCIPTKTLIASARTAHVARRAAEYGVSTGPVTVDMKAVKARKDAIVETSRVNLANWLENRANLTVRFGTAKFVGAREIVVDGNRFAAERIFINVGGNPTVPDWPGLADVPFLTSSTMMDVDFLPEHLIVVGGSYIGLEFAQMYRRFGAAVSVIEYSGRLVAREDADVSDGVRAILENEGIAVVTGARDIEVAKAEPGVAVTLKTGGVEKRIEGSHLLFAIGRRPNTADLGLEAAGIAVDERGFIVVDDTLQTNVAGVYALGDCNGRGAFTHTSYNDYEIVAANLLDGGDRRVSDRIPTYALFTDPPLGRVGMSEAEVRANGRKALVATLPMTRVGRARERGETEGFMKIHVDAVSKRILGAAFLGLEGDEVIQSILNVMAADAPYTVVAQTMYIHPTVSELIPTLLQGLQPLES